MANIDYLIYLVHGVFWASFGIGRLVNRAQDDGRGGGATAPAAGQQLTARFSRSLVLFHGLAFVAMYNGLAFAIIPHRVPFWFRGQRLVGAIVIAAGGALAGWAVATFRSWRVRAKLEEDHELVTRGPFRWLRHPIYMGFNLLAVGSAIWVPSPFTFIAILLMAIGSDLRARAEEKLLIQAFGASYKEYAARTQRFIPGIY